MASLKFNADKIKKLPSNLRNLESKIDILDTDKFLPVQVGLSKLGDAVKNDDIKKDVCNAKIKNVEDEIPDC